MLLKKEVLKINPKIISKKIQKFIRYKTKELNRNGIAIGLSGGLDSSVLACLCVKALGKNKVYGLIMPEKEGNPKALDDAKFIANWLGIKTKVIDITPELKSLGLYKFILSRIPTRKLKEKAVNFVYKKFEKDYGESPFAYGLKGTNNRLLSTGIAHFKTKHRTRMVVLYYYAESNNLLVAGAANKSEKLTGLFCKFGVDDNADTMPIGNLYRTQILQLAKYLKLPERITNKSSNPDIIPGVEDKYEYLTGLNSEKVDLILFGLEKNIKPNEISKQLKIPLLKINNIKKLNERSFHMRNPSITLDF